MLTVDIASQNVGASEADGNLVSVVIPTLGGESLLGTIKQLNRGFLVPAEILICIPAEEAFSVSSLSFPNVRIIRTDCRGQVAQRAIGFRQAQHPMVLQLDDDIIVHEGSLQLLVKALENLGPGNAVAPVYFDLATGNCLHKVKTGLSGFLNSFTHSLFCGAPWGANRMGVITKVGINYGVDLAYCTLNPFETMWLSGGCVLCFKEDLITESFYPYPGKAYGEDIFHSLLRSQRGIRHWVIPDTKCFTDMPESNLNQHAIQAENRARRHYLKLMGGSGWRLFLFELVKGLKRKIWAAF